VLFVPFRSPIRQWLRFGSLIALFCKLPLIILLWCIKRCIADMGSRFSVARQGGKESVGNVRSMVRRCWNSGGTGFRATCITFVIFCAPCACGYCIFLFVRHFVSYYRNRYGTQVCSIHISFEISFEFMIKYFAIVHL